MPGKKHKVKGKTLNLNDFLGTDQDAPTGYAVVNTRRLNWADTMENEVVDEKYTIDCKKDEKIILPTAPKAARGPDVDMSKVPSKPPYTVYLGNLPYDVSDEDVIKFFRTLKSLKSRSIKVSLAEEHDNEGRERGNRDMGRSERATDGDWRSMTRDDGDDGGRPDHSYGSSRGFDDSDGGYRRSGFGRDSDRDGGDRDRSFGGGFSRDRPRGFGDRDQGYDRDRGFERRSGGGGGYERPRDYDRGYGGGSSGGSRDYGSSYRDDRDSRDRYRSDDHPSERDQDSGPRERKKLQLKPRSVPVEAPAKEAAAAAAPAAPAPAKASAAIFGGARPVDTAAREREIEERLAKQREEEERKQIMSREPFVDSRKDERVRRSSVGSGSGRSRRSSESGGRDSYDEGARQPVSRQYSNDSDQQYSASQGSRQPPHGHEGSAASKGGERPSERARWGEPGGARDGHSSRNGGERLPSKPDLAGGKADDGKVVYTSKNIYSHLQDEEGHDVSD